MLTFSFYALNRTFYIVNHASHPVNATIFSILPFPTQTHYIHYTYNYINFSTYNYHVLHLLSFCSLILLYCS